MKKNELKELSSKFKELRSLIYDYKNRKDNEIIELNKSQANLKAEIETNQKNYEKLIDEATEEISDFVEKANFNNLS